MTLGRYLRETKEQLVLIETKDNGLFASGKPMELFKMLSAFLLKSEVIKVVQEIDEFPYSVVIDCEVFINVSKR